MEKAECVQSFALETTTKAFSWTPTDFTFVLQSLHCADCPPFCLRKWCQTPSFLYSTKSAIIRQQRLRNSNCDARKRGCRAQQQQASERTEPTWARRIMGSAGSAKLDTSVHDYRWLRWVISHCCCSTSHPHGYFSPHPPPGTAECSGVQDIV